MRWYLLFLNFILRRYEYIGIPDCINQDILASVLVLLFLLHSPALLVF